MKLILIAFFLLTIKHVDAQPNSSEKIDTSNYYNYYYNYFSNDNKLKGSAPTTAWLQLNEVVSILMDELKNAGYEWLYEHSLFKVGSGQYIVISAYTRKSNFGFLYIEGHAVFPRKEDRRDFTQNRLLGADYSSCEETPSGSPNFIKIKKLPKNVFVLNENCYWYQFTTKEDDNKILVTKDVAIQILKQDIKAYLNKAPKPKNK